jgi:hypothetical protein
MDNVQHNIPIMNQPLSQSFGHQCRLFVKYLAQTVDPTQVYNLQLGGRKESISDSDSIRTLATCQLLAYFYQDILPIRAQ